METDIERLYLEHVGLIKNCARKLVKQFGCPHLLDDLVSTGTLAFLVHLDGYIKSRDVSLSTYLYPHIVGAQRREIENSLTAFSLSKREFQTISKANILSSVAGISIDGRQDADGTGIAERLQSTELPVDIFVYQKMCVELVREVFENELSYRDREILGSFFGVFGHRKRTLAEIGEQFNMRENAALKAKDKALNKLTDLCFDSEFGVWHEAFRAVMDITRSGMSVFCY